MAVNQDYLNYISGQLDALEGFTTKKMFGGVGFFWEGKMFGLIGHDIFHLKVNDTNRTDYEAYGMKAFLADTKRKGMPYWEVPVEILEDPPRLVAWAKKSIAINLAK